MSADSDKAVADSTTPQESIKEAGEQAESPEQANGEAKQASNGLTAQLEEKIIRQVEVCWATWSLVVL